MNALFTRVSALALVTLAGCAGQSVSTAPAPPVTPTSEATPGPGGPGPVTALAPLTAAPANRPVVSTSAEPSPAVADVLATEPAPVGMTLLDTTVSGDATRIVLPTSTLVAGQLYPVLIFAHGHGQDQTQLNVRTNLAAAAAKEGWLSAGGDFGGRAAWADDVALQDVGNLVAELVADHQADPKRIYLSGFSMGGGTALLAAANPLGLPYQAAAVVSTQGFTDLQAMTLPEAGGGQYAADINAAYGGLLTPALATAHSPQDVASQLTGLPVYLEHGAADTNVPDHHIFDMAAKLTALGHPPELHIYPGLTHSESTIHTDSIITFLRGKSLP